MKSAPVSQTFFIAGKSEGNFAGQEHIRSSLNNFMSSFASMILIHGLLGLSDSFIIIIIFINLSYVCLTKIFQRLQEEILRGLFRFAASVADVPTLVRLQVCSKFEKNPRGLCYATYATFCLQVVGDFNAVLRAPRESRESEKSICWEFLRISTAHA